jgi:hypothetical protein
MPRVVHTNGGAIPGAPHDRLANGIDYLLVLGGLFYCLAATTKAPKDVRYGNPILWAKKNISNNGEYMT